MEKEVLDEREFELVNIIGAKLGSNQRDLSRLMDLSLGMVNMLIRRLIAKGSIRINQLNKRKVEYILTPKGLSEKMQKSVKYMMKTVHSISIIKNQLKELLLPLIKDGERDFTILGKSDFAVLVEMVLRDLGIDRFQIQYLEDLPEVLENGALLICKEEFGTKKISYKFINLLEELSKKYALTSQMGVG